MTYPKILNYLFSRLPMFHRIGAAAYKADLSNTVRISIMLRHPERDFRSIHVAGTNGKGSVSHFMASILQESGYKTGLFTSPHLKDFRERIRINGKMIPKSSVKEFVMSHIKDFERITPSFFEWTFALASWYFSREKVDVAVMETGMGGRLDSTNIIHPDLCIITNIGWDHTQFLGDSLEKIAAEKAGIIKKGIPVVIGETLPETTKVFRKKARELSAPLTRAEELLSIAEYSRTQKVPFLLKARLVQTKGKGSWELSSPLSGEYQLKNLRTVLAAVIRLREQGYPIEDEHIINGIRHVVRNTRLMGRWQVLSTHPLTIADIGHNKDGIREVISQLKLTPHRKLHFVIGVVNDKDVTAMLAQLPKDAVYYFCKADIPRGLDAGELSNTALTFGLFGETYASVKEAYNAARSSADPDDLVLVGGSAFVVAEIL